MNSLLIQSKWFMKSVAFTAVLLLISSFNASAVKYNIPSNITPTGGGSYCQNSSATLSTSITYGGGQCGSGPALNMPVTYQWYSNTVNSNSGGTLIGGATASTYSPPTGTIGTTYYYCVITWSTCTSGTLTSGTQVIDVYAPPCYCTPTETQSSAAGYISNVSINTINNSSGFSAGGYSNNTGCTTVAAGAIYTLSVTGASIVGSSNYITAFIDYNADGDFADAGESIVLSSTWNGSTTNTDITIPGTASCGSTVKFRLIFEYASATTTTEANCGATSSAYGETEDYCFTIACNAPTCDDGIMNQDETGVDCGGASCPPCVDACHDGIQNSDETGVDCGGAFCLPCTTNGTGTTSTGSCSSSAQASVYPTVCAQVGTTAYDLNSPIIEIASTSTSAPVPAPTGCGAVSTGTGSWSHLTLEDGVDYIQLAFDQNAAGLTADGVGSGNSTTYAALYQGTACGSLSYVSCQPLVDFNSGTYGVYQATWDGLDPSQDIWIYTWNDNGKGYNLDFHVIGVEQHPTNTTCATSETALDQGCNLGATGAPFTAPNAAGYACSGGGWGSNENTTFYSFTATETTGSLEIENITCNNGTNGNAQFAVWTSCAGIGTYGAGSGFLGCAVGTAAISLSPLTPGQTYYIATDGFAGDNCIFSFTGTGILLPIELGSFTGFHTGHSVELDWTTITEKDNDYFIVQRTLDGVSYEEIGMVDGEGNSTRTIDYEFTDIMPYQGVSYYRIKQVDYNGEFAYSDIISVSSSEDKNLRLLYSINVTGQQVDYTYKGIVIDVYSDGSTQKRYQNPQE